MNVVSGVVTSTSPLTARVDGSFSPIPARRLSTYQPTTGDRVVLTTSGSEVIILGRVI